MRLLSYEGRKKLYYMLILTTVSVSAYLIVKYVLPIFLPFILAYLISLVLHKAVNFLNRRMKVNSKVAVFLVLGSVIVIIIGGILLIFAKLVEQTKVLIENADRVIIVIEDMAHSVCDMLGKTFGINSGKVYRVIEVNMDKLTRNASGDLWNKIYSNTTGIAKSTMNFIILLIFVFTAIIYMTKNMDAISKGIEKSFFSKEIKELKRLFKQVFVAYIKAQLVIIVVTALICTSGLFLLKNPYCLTIGVLIGIVDALPLLGTAIVLLPWTLIMVLRGDYFYAAVLFTMFLLSYMAREFIEPKIMGKDIGISPILSLVAIYVGYTLFGFIGMFIGPLVFVVIVGLMKKVRSKLEKM